MKVIIDISEEDFNLIKNTSEKFASWEEKPYIRMIKNGTPLPKSYGNLVDIDRLFDIIFNPRDGILEIYKDRPRTQLENELESAFDQAQTIIRADKEGK